MKLGLREKILFPVIGLFLLVSGGIGIVSSLQATSLFQERSAQALDHDVRKGAAQIDQWFSDRLLDTRSWAGQEGLSKIVADPGALSALNAQLARTVALFPYGKMISLLDATGLSVASSDPANPGKRYGDRGYFKEAIQGKANLSEPLISRSTGLPVVVAASPANPSGVLIFTIGLERFSEQFLDVFAIDSFSYGFVFKLDDGMIVAHPDTSFILRKTLDSMELAPLVRRAMQDETVDAEIGGRSRQVEYASIPSMGMGLVVVSDLEGERDKLARARWIQVFIALFGAVGACVVVIFVIVFPMLRSLREAIAFAHAVGEGDISTTLDSRSTDEIGQLVRTLATMGANLRLKEESVVRIAARDLTADPPAASKRDALGNALRTMVGNLRDVLGKARDGAVGSEQAAERFQRLSMEVAGAAEETSSQSRVLAKASDMVHQNVQAVAAGTEEMGASIREIARSASETSRVASEAVAKAERTNALVAKLGEASTQIGAVVEVISGIAGQTNLLALNATIEAARAGEAGKGFAVVAGEVKELSKATGAATSDIATKIRLIQEQMGQAVESIQEISQVIRKVDTLSQSIAAAVEEQTAATGEIAQSIAEASRGIGEVNQGLSQAAEAADQTARSAAEIRVGSDELRTQAAKVSAEVSVFRLS